MSKVDMVLSVDVSDLTLQYDGEIFDFSFWPTEKCFM